MNTTMTPSPAHRGGAVTAFCLPARRGAPIEDEQSAVAILHSGRVDDDVQQQAERVDQDMPFAAGDLLGRIKALRVKRGAPF